MCALKSCFLHTQTPSFGQPVVLLLFPSSLGTHRKIQSWAGPQTATQGVWVKHGISTKTLVWIPANLGAASEQSPFSLAVTQFLWLSSTLQLPFLPQHLGKLPLQVSCPGVLQRKTSVPDLVCATLPGCHLQTGDALGFRHWLITNAVLLFGLEMHLYLTKQ